MQIRVHTQKSHRYHTDTQMGYHDIILDANTCKSTSPGKFAPLRFCSFLLSSADPIRRWGRRGATMESDSKGQLGSNG